MTTSPLRDDRRADAFQYHAQHPHNGMHLRQIAAGGAQLLPDIGHGINAEHLYAEVGEVQDALVMSTNTAGFA